MARGSIGFDKNDARLKDGPLMLFAKEYANFFIKQFQLGGRLSRLDFIRFASVTQIIVFSILVLMKDLDLNNQRLENIISNYTAAISILLFIFSIIRRLHDMGKSVLSLFPFGLTSPLTYLGLFGKGEPFQNKYGPPKSIEV